MIKTNYKFVNDHSRLKIASSNATDNTGFRCYGKCLGFFALLFGFGSRIKTSDGRGKSNIWVVNKKSYSNWFELQKARLPENYGSLSKTQLTTLIDALIKSKKPVSVAISSNSTNTQIIDKKSKTPSYPSIDYSSTNYEFCLQELDWELTHKNSMTLRTTNDPDFTDEYKIKFVETFKDNPEIFYAKNTALIDEKFTSDLSKAFSEGKKLAVFKIHKMGGFHTECAAFDHKGNFVVVGGLPGHPIIDNIEHFADYLNGANIKDGSGNPITFSGKYVNTRLQRGGHMCVRIAELYRYQIAKENSLDAYKKVNGAFYEGRLQSFEDIETIEQAIEIDVMPSPSKENDWEKGQYEFFLSFACRGYGVKQNKWQDITIKDILPELKWVMRIAKKTPIDQYFCGFQNNHAVPHYLTQKYHRLVNIQESDKHYVSEDIPFGELFKDKNNFLVIDKEGKHFLVHKDKVESSFKEF